MSTITFGSRMKKSYKVTYKGPYKNDRDPHVETPIEDLTGKEFQLGSKRSKLIGNNVAIMYDIIGLPNAHITVYFGPKEGSLNY